MRYSILFLVLLSATISQLSGQDKGIWVAYDSGKEYAADYLQAVGGNCLIYYPTVNADTVLAFDTYSHQWHEHPFHLSVLSSNAYAGENAAMVWNDSVLVLYDAIHSTFHDLKLDGEMIHSGSKPFNLPGNVCSLSYAITTEKIYIFDHETQEWFVYAYTNPGTGGPFTYSGNGKDDYVMISIANYPTSESKVIAFSKSRRVFEEISSVSLEWNILDHGFACWANVGIPEGDCFFTAYSAENGFMETIKPNRDFGTNINWNDPVAESTVFMATYYIPHESSPGGIRHIYAADTRHAAFNYYTFDDAYTGNSGNTLNEINTGFGAGVVTTKDLANYEISANFFDGSLNSFFSAGKSVLHSNTSENGYYAGTTYFTGYDTYHFIFHNMAQSHLHTIELPAPTEGYQNQTVFRLNADWGIAMCQRALSNTISIYSFNTNSDSVQTIVEPAYTYDFDKMKSKYFYYGSQAYNDAKKILVYEPLQDVWTTLPLASDGKWFFGENFICTYDKSDGNLKIHDVPANHELAFPLGWQSSYDFDKHTYGKEKFFIASNTEGHYFGYSSYTGDIRETVADYYYLTQSAPLNGMVAVMYNSSSPKDFLAYNALSNSFIPLQLSDEQGGCRNVWMGDSTMLVTTAHGHLLAFDPYPEATAIKDRATGKDVLPQHFSLAQNFPNPFGGSHSLRSNPTTVISWQLAVGSNVELAVYDLLGKKIKKLVNEKQAAGTHSIQFNGSGLASGIYIYRLKTSSGFVQSKKCIFVK